MKVFEPLRMYLSPLRTAVVVSAAASEPHPGSVSPMQPIHSPVASFGQVLLLLRLRPVLQDVGRAEVGVGAPGQDMAAVDTGMADRFAGEATGDEIRPRPAVLLRNGKTEQSHLTEFPPDIEAEFPLQVGLLAQGCDLALRKPVDGLPEHLLFFADREIHKDSFAGFQMWTSPRRARHSSIVATCRP